MSLDQHAQSPSPKALIRAFLPYETELIKTTFTVSQLVSSTWIPS